MEIVKKPTVKPSCNSLLEGETLVNSGDSAVVVDMSSSSTPSSNKLPSPASPENFDERNQYGHLPEPDSSTTNEPAVLSGTIATNKTSSPSSDDIIVEIYVPPNDTDVKPILRTSQATSRSSTPSSVSRASPTPEELTSKESIVKFHPLALLLDAALEGDLKLVEEVAATLEDVSEPNDEGITALHNAVCAGRTEIAEFLVREAGADVNAGDTDGWTPLHCAASCANLVLARLLVENGAALHARTLSDYETPLEKCDHVDEDADCEEYLYVEHERLGSLSNGHVYAVFDRGCVPEDPIESDELSVCANDELRVLDKNIPSESEWVLAENLGNSTKGLIPKSFISCYKLRKIPKQWYQRIADAKAKYPRVLLNQTENPFTEVKESTKLEHSTVKASDIKVASADIPTSSKTSAEANAEDGNMQQTAM